MLFWGGEKEKVRLRKVERERVRERELEREGMERKRAF